MCVRKKGLITASQTLESIIGQIKYLCELTNGRGCCVAIMLCIFLTSQVQQRIARSGQTHMTVSMPVQTSTSLTMPFYSNPMMFSQTNTRSVQDTNQRHADGEFSQDGQLR